MKAAQQLHDVGQSLWLDNITRGLLTSGTLGRYINELSVTGLTSNPTIFEHAIDDAGFPDDAIRQKALAGESGEALFFELALEDLTQAADLFRPIHDATDGIDGWVSLEVYMRGIERRLAAGRDARVASVASIFVSRWDVAATDKVPDALRNRLGIAIAMRFDGGNAEAVFAEFTGAGINDEALAADLQREGTAAFVKSWNDLMSRVVSKNDVLTKADQA